MQYFNPELPQGLHASHLLDQSLADRKYDIVWLQWAAGYLNDDQLVAFLQRCRHALSTPTEEDPEGGLIIVKENITRIAVYHDEDSSITRSVLVKLRAKQAHRNLYRTDKDFHRCFKRAGLDVVKEEVQKGFPEGLFVVRTCGCRVIYSVVVHEINAACTGML